ncbi:MAG: DUF116 domain-containing protein [Ruminiclostridium sp.]|nr:DUF116 domain-containing protein [Ruminiclostridium sp.]
MKVKYLDKRITNFLTFSFLLLLVFALAIAVFTYVYNYFTIDSYDQVLLIFIIFAVITIIIITYAILAVFLAYRKRSVSAFMLLPVRLALKIVIPFTIFITGLLKKDKDAIRSLFIDMNNLLVQSGEKHYKPDRILMLLPHCLQDSKCNHKITGDIANCRECGKCTIGPILGIVREKGVKAVVVTGGTAARNIIIREKPDVILSVACERDLAGGIADVGGIPVIGVVNERPNGPCKDTCVNVRLLGE